MIGGRRLLLRAVQVALVVAALWLAVRELGLHWAEFRTAAGTLRPSMLPLLGSVGAVLLLYAVQIHAWRTIVSAWDARLPFWDAARIWCLSNLARFLPASPLFTTGTMGVLASRAGVSPVVAAGSALIGTVLNLGTGFVVVVIAGAGLLPKLAPRLPAAAGPALAVLGGVALIALPLSISPLVRLASRVLKRPIDLPPLPLSILLVAVTANLAAWFLYGLALRWLTLAFFPGSGSNLIAYLAVFTAGYLAGFLFIPVPAGFGVRETALLAGLQSARLVTAGEAAIVVVASRLLLTLLEALPGALFLLARPAARRPRSTS